MNNGSTDIEKDRLRKAMRTTATASSAYDPVSALYYFLQMSQRPLFTLMQAQSMRRDYAVKFALAIRNGPLQMAEVEVSSASPEVAQFVQNEFSALWSKNAKKILATKCFGYSGFEPIYKEDQNGKFHIAGLADFSPADIRPLIRGREVVGMSVRNVRSSQSPSSAAPVTPTKMFRPKALWTTFDDEYSLGFGKSILEGAYEPWWEKVMSGGGNSLRRLRMLKDAWIGDVIFYPPARSYWINGKEVTSSSIADAAASSRYTGGALCLPMEYDENGKELWKYQAPTQVQGATEVLAYVDTLDDKIFKALNVPLEVIEAAETGSGFSGRSIPLISLLMILQNEFDEYIQSIDNMVMRPLTWVNYGNCDYEIKSVPLLETMTSKIAPSGPSIPTGGGGIAGGVMQMSGDDDVIRIPRNAKGNLSRFAKTTVTEDMPGFEGQKREVYHQTGEPLGVRYGEYKTHEPTSPEEYSAQRRPLMQSAIKVAERFPPAQSEMLKTAADNLSNEELSQVDYVRAKSILDKLASSVPSEQLEAATKAGLTQKLWYGWSNDVFHHFGHDRGVMLSILATMSPRTSVEENLKQALDVYNEWNRNGRQYSPVMRHYVTVKSDDPLVRILRDPGERSRLAKNSGNVFKLEALDRQASPELADAIRAGIRSGRLVPSKVETQDWLENVSTHSAGPKSPNLNRVLKAASENALPDLTFWPDLSGQKVEYFGRSLSRGDESMVHEAIRHHGPVALDMWMGLLFGGNGEFGDAKWKKDNNGIWRLYQPGGNLGYLANFRQVAKRAGVTPTQAQAAAWSLFRTFAEGASGGMSPKQLLTDITHADVAGTSDYANLILTHPECRNLAEQIDDQLRALSRQPGWTGPRPGLIDGARRVALARQQSLERDFGDNLSRAAASGYERVLGPVAERAWEARDSANPLQRTEVQFSDSSGPTVAVEAVDQYGDMMLFAKYPRGSTLPSGQVTEQEVWIPIPEFVQLADETFMERTKRTGVPSAVAVSPDIGDTFSHSMPFPALGQDIKEQDIAAARAGAKIPRNQTVVESFGDRHAQQLKRMQMTAEQSFQQSKLDPTAAKFYRTAGVWTDPDKSKGLQAEPSLFVHHDNVQSYEQLQHLAAALATHEGRTQKSTLIFHSGAQTGAHRPVRLWSINIPGKHDEKTAQAWYDWFTGSHPELAQAGVTPVITDRGLELKVLDQSLSMHDYIEHAVTEAKSQGKPIDVEYADGEGGLWPPSGYRSSRPGGYESEFGGPKYGPAERSEALPAYRSALRRQFSDGGAGTRFRVPLGEERDQEGARELLARLAVLLGVQGVDPS